MKTKLRRHLLLILAATSFLPLAQAVESDEHLRALRSNDAMVQNLKTRAINVLSAIEAYRGEFYFPPEQRFELHLSSPARRFTLARIAVTAGEQVLLARDVSDKELYAMRVGGVSRIFRGNVAPGRFPLRVDISGELDGGQAVEYSAELELLKTEAPLQVELRVKDVPGNPGVGLDARERGAGL